MSDFRLAIVGDGKMGRAIAELARERGYSVTAVLGLADNANGGGITRDRLGDTEVVIEFTDPDAAPTNIVAAVRAHPVVPVTTGYPARTAATMFIGAASGSVNSITTSVSPSRSRVIPPPFAFSAGPSTAVTV